MGYTDTLSILFFSWWYQYGDGMIQCVVIENEIVREIMNMWVVLYWVVPENIHTHTTGGISEFRRGGGLCRLEFRGHGGIYWIVIPKARGDFQESNFQVGVVESLQGKRVKNDLSKSMIHS